MSGTATGSRLASMVGVLLLVHHCACATAHACYCTRFVYGLAGRALWVVDTINWCGAGVTELQGHSWSERGVQGSASRICSRCMMVVGLWLHGGPY